MGKKKGSQANQSVKKINDVSQVAQSSSSPSLSSSPSITIGISIGSHSSCVAYFKDGRSHVITNEDGERTTPICISFREEEMIVGTQAKNQLVSNRKNTITEFIHLIGKSFIEVSDDRRHYEFVEIDQKPCIQIQFSEETKTFSPEELVTFQLSKVKQSAEDYLGAQIAGTVISVPVCFTEIQIDSLRNSASKAGLNVLSIIKDPIAALIGFGLGQKYDEYEGDKLFFIFDLGASFLDLSIVKSFGGLFHVVNTQTVRLGAKDFDEKLVEHLSKEFLKKHRMDISENPKSVAKLRMAAEQAKRALSNAQVAQCSVESLHDGVDFHTNVNRTALEISSSDLYQRCYESLQTMIQQSSLSLDSIDEVLLIGGGASIPKVQQLVESFFQHKKIHKSSSPDEYCASGAAFQATLMSKKGEDIYEQATRFRALPSSIKICGLDGKVCNLVNKLCPLPVKRKLKFAPFTTESTEIYVSFVKGDSEDIKENEYLFTTKLDGFAIGSRVEGIECEILVEENGSVRATLTHLQTAKKDTRTI